ncbi:MAG: methylenetetrahydrofolate--tRNA-(uracil(54)-C(5))-methyltransferase (FADH(2)-oxidizing) TrmFO [Proteobacteria bacterium]|nr:methylenetetrahydrofolate--tRNA-(uracil(54)-C(5))-methyltransferase (FADH(2)-oxidizing) TrmFO [Pseudomonadota bacterium]MBU4294424.1 methylenetetrahydrofolate--tRNA-(uracil(54)-C(5))-methyltransferase (FADH(2)-oxidizing) TrmFO [Pseudomonadota bacterium]MCG2747606.1 methylenetetrahydrofolate--tRNA-(uracil(54)-C(5))-methyltransferase (FADH(2)-oxidizing) TrmFO [Desulfobulbaceae bacterium]
MDNRFLTIIGGGLAGCEAAWQAAKRGFRVILYDMKPQRFSPAHSSSDLAELVCSNSFRSDDPSSAVGLLKEEMRQLDSLIMAAAAVTKVPAGKALAVDRSLFARFITERIESLPAIEIRREEISEIPLTDESHPLLILATGPLTADGLARSLQEITGEHLAFYDAIAPIITADSLNREIIYQASRYDDGPGDYLNCPMDKAQYLTFITELAAADKVKLKSFEEKKYFEGCLPIEVMLERGVDTLRFGPMKPVGLSDPRTGRDPYAVVQLRKENMEGTHYNMVGFQTKLTYSEQQRVFRLIPGMEQAEFERLGSIHRNTFVCGPKVLEPTLQLKTRQDILLAGQLTGVEGYVESTAMGLLAGINAAHLLQGRKPVPPPAETALGALIRHLTDTDAARFQPSNINFGLFATLTSQDGKKVPKKFRGQLRAEKALAALREWQAALHEG